MATSLEPDLTATIALGMGRDSESTAMTPTAASPTMARARLPIIAPTARRDTSF